MVDGKTFKESMAEEKVKWGQMDRAQKWDYFKSYYLTRTLVIIAVLIALVSYARAVKQNKREVLLGGYFVNVNADDSFYTHVNEDYFAYLGGDEKKQQMDISTGGLIELTENGYDNTAYATDMSIVAMFSTKALDFMFLDDTTLERYGRHGVFADLSKTLTPKQLEYFGDRIVEIEDEDGNRYPGAICLTETALQEEYHIYSVYGPNPYLVLVSTGSNFDHAAEFVDYLFEIQ